MHFWIGFLALLLLAAVVFLVKYFRRWRRVDRELKAVRDELEIQREAARQEQKRKKDLVAFLAHDLKTPLTSVVGYLTLLSDKPGLYPAERERYTAVALEKARRLESLLEEFFDISRMELHQDSDKRETVQLTLLLEQITDEFYPLLENKGLKLEADIAPGLAAVGDADKLARVFDNVLRNAVSYSHEGGTIRLTASLEEGRVHIRIANRGLGIPEKELSNIFERFYRLDAARSTRTGGAGLGLAIAKEIVDSHGGSIAAESTGEDTVFHIVLPASAP
ncbi:MAG: HAMP domain-containing histidine kinase [Oscillospiraceae bacterium]|jgi:two-component system sensor histidine kinase VanS